MTASDRPRQGPGAAATETDYAAASRAALVEALAHAGPGQPTLCEGWRTEHLAAHIVLRETSPLAVGLILPPTAKWLEEKTIALGDAHADEAGYARLLERVAAGPLDGALAGQRHDDGPGTSDSDRTSDSTGASDSPGASDSRGAATSGGTGAPGAPARSRGRRARGRVAGLVQRAAARLRGTSVGSSMADAVQLLEFYVHTEDVRRAQDRWAPRILADDYADTLYTHLKRRAKLLYRSEETGVELERRARPASQVDNSPVMVKAPGDDGRSLHIAGPAGELVMHAFGRRTAALVLEDVVDA